MKLAPWVETMKRDYRPAALTESDRATPDYAAKLTRALNSVEKSDVDRLREVGFGDKAIGEINQIVGLFAWVNRAVEGLGVKDEDW